MSAQSSAVYLVTGANRGIGLGLVTYIAAERPNAFIYATARDPTKVPGLDELAAKYPGRIAIVKYDSADPEDVVTLAKEIEAKHGRVDTVIANAGLARPAGTSLTTSASELEEFFTTNLVGPVILFQALSTLLKKSASPRFVPISSAAGSIGGATISQPIASLAYGSSKAALNHATRKIHFENEWIIAFPLSPGGVINDTVKEQLEADKSGTFAKMLEDYHMQTPEEAAHKIINIIDEATREKDGGEFPDVDGTRLPW